MNTVKTAQFSRGIVAVEAALAKPVYATERRAKFFGLADGESAIIRFVTDMHDLIPASRHDSVPTKPGPATATGWPPAMNAVCRHQEAFRGIHDDCYVCDFKIAKKHDPSKLNKPTPKIWAVACLRTDVDKDGKPFADGGRRDKPRKAMIKDGDGEAREVTERSLVVICQAGKNFWDNLLPVALRLGSLCGQDFEVMRHGASLDTNYLFLPLDKDPVLNPSNPDGDGAKVRWSNYQDAMDTQGLDLELVISGQASDEYFAKFFDKRYTVNDQGIVVPTGDVPDNSPEGKAKAQTMQDKINKMRAGVAEPAPAPADDEPDF